MRVPTPCPPLVTPRGIAVSDSEKAEALTDNVEALFQPVTDPSVPADIETVDVAPRSYFLSPASEPHLTTPDEVHEAIRGLKVSKARGPNGITNRALKYFPKRKIFHLARILNVVLRTLHFPQMWKHARVISILKPGKDQTLPSFYRPFSILDTIGKLFENIIVSRILHVVNERGLMRGEQFGFIPRHRTSLQLARHVISSIHAGCGNSGSIELFCSVQFVCQRYAPPS